MSRFDRQSIIDGWNQENISDKTVSIVGMDVLGQLSLLYLSGLGINKFIIVDNKKNIESKDDILKDLSAKYKVEAVSNAMRRLNSDLTIDTIVAPPADGLVGKKLNASNLIIDAFNNSYWKEKTYGIAAKSPYTFAYISAASTPLRGNVKYVDVSTTAEPNDLESMMFFDSVVNRKNQLINYIMEDIDKRRKLERGYLFEYLMEDYDDKNQGILPSGYLAAIVTDLVRFTFLPLKELNEFYESGIQIDLPITMFSYNLSSLNRFNINRHTIQDDNFSDLAPDLPKKKALIVGAGGIGTYAGLVLSKLNFDIDIVDFDIVEDHNLNRQVLYDMDDVINKRVKSEALVEKLRKISPENNYNALKYRLDISHKEEIRSKNYDIIYSCVDNPHTRKVLSEIVVDLQVPYVDGGVNAFDARVEFYYPGKMKCFNCRYDNYNTLIKMYDDARKNFNTGSSCSEVVESSVVVTNAVAGSLMASESLGLLYPSKFYNLALNKIRFTSSKINFPTNLYNLSEIRGKCKCQR